MTREACNKLEKEIDRKEEQQRKVAGAATPERSRIERFWKFIIDRSGDVEKLLPVLEEAQPLQPRPSPYQERQTGQPRGITLARIWAFGMFTNQRRSARPLLAHPGPAHPVPCVCLFSRIASLLGNVNCRGRRVFT